MNLKLVFFLFLSLGHLNYATAEEGINLDDLRVSLDILNKIEGGLKLEMSLHNDGEFTLHYLKRKVGGSNSISLFDEELTIMNMAQKYAKNKPSMTSHDPNHPNYYKNENQPKEYYLSLASGESVSHQVTFMFDINNLASMNKYKDKKYSISAMYPLVRKINGRFKIDILHSPKIELPQNKEMNTNN